MKPGIYDLPYQQYEAVPAASKHLLDSLAVSPLHCWSWHINPERLPRRETPSQLVGHAIHTAILEPERFEKEYIQEPQVEDYKGVLVTLDDYKAECKRRELPVTGTKDILKGRILAQSPPDGLFWDDRYSDITQGKTVLPIGPYRATVAIRNRVRKHPAASELFKYGKAEQSIFWTDSETGVDCKGRLDWVTSLQHPADSNPNQVIVDLKSTTDASPEGFQRSISKYRYYVQAAMYIDSLMALGYDPDAFIFAAWEKSAPYASALYYASTEMIEAGRVEYKRLLKIYADCLSKDKWPGYSTEIKSIELPATFQPYTRSDEESEDDWLDQMANS